MGAITTNGDVTLTHDAAKIKHTGATSFTIESTGTDGSVVVDGVKFTDGDVSDMGTLSCGAITSTGDLDL